MLGTIRVGMSVQSADGEQLGTVVAVSAEDFRIAKGLGLPKGVPGPLAQDVVSVAADTVTLRQTVEELARPAEGAVSGAVPPENMSPDHVSQVLRAATSPHDLGRGGGRAPAGGPSHGPGGRAGTNESLTRPAPAWSV